MITQKSNYMVTQNTLLSRHDLALLEEALLKFGKIVSFEDLFQVFSSKYSRGELRKRVATLSRRGWLVRVKKGLYVVITDISTLGFFDVSGLVISQTLNKNSYISFENALQYYGMFDQMLSGVEAVTSGRARDYKTQGKIYRFSHIKNKLYFGFSKIIVQSEEVQVAEKEKAILDMLYFRSSSYTVDLILEKLREYKEDIDFKKLKNYARMFGLTMIREVGFLLDLLNIDTQDLYKSRKSEGGYSKMTKDSSQFNAKWRLYYDRTI